MKELLLLRHAKSDWGDPSLPDIDRPLAKRGRKNAPLMGRMLAEQKWIPDRALVSPAVRTRQTWQKIAAEWPAVPPARFPEELYEAQPETILSLVRQAPAGIRRLLVVGHNPGLEELAAMLSGPGSDPEALMRMREKFPTAGFARFTTGSAWSDLRPGSAALAVFLTPKQLSGASTGDAGAS